MNFDSLVTNVYGFKDKEIKRYLGGIEYFLNQHKIENLRKAEKKTVVAKVKNTTKKKNVSQLSKDQEKEVRKLKNKSSGIDNEIADLEVKIEKMDLYLAINYEETFSKDGFFEEYKAPKKGFNGYLERN